MLLFCPRRGGGDLTGCLWYFLGVLVALRVFSLQRSIAGAFAVPFRVLSRRKNIIGDNVLFKNWNFLGPSYMVSGTRDNPSPEVTLSSVYM